MESSRHGQGSGESGWTAGGPPADGGVSSRDHPRYGGYAESAEFHDLFMVEPWERLRPHINDAFADLGPEETILEIGAGSGMGTRVIATETRAQITAIEPAPAMRTALTLAVASDPSLADRVTLVAGAAPTVIEADDRPVDGFVCAHMLGHLGAADRARTFLALRARMTLDAVGLLTLPPDTDPDPETIAAHREERRLGRFDYTSRYVPDPDGDGFVVEYQVAEGDRVLRTERFAETWSHPTRQDLVAELDAAGLDCELDARIGLVRARREIRATHR